MNENIENIGNIENKAQKLIKKLMAENKQLNNKTELLQQQLNIVLRINDKLSRENKLILNDLKYYQERCAYLEETNLKLEGNIEDFELEVSLAEEQYESELSNSFNCYYEEAY